MLMLCTCVCCAPPPLIEVALHHICCEPGGACDSAHMALVVAFLLRGGHHGRVTACCRRSWRQELHPAVSHIYPPSAVPTTSPVCHSARCSPSLTSPTQPSQYSTPSQSALGQSPYAPPAMNLAASLRLSHKPSAANPTAASRLSRLTAAVISE